MGRPVVLVVDDDAEQGKLLSHLLSQYYDVRTAHSGPAAVALAAQQPFEVAIVRAAMGAMPGIQVLGKLSLLQPDCMRILLGDQNDPNVLRDAINLGRVQRFLAAHTDVQTLREEIERALEERHLLTERGRLERLAAVSVLAGTVAHDLRNGLQVLTMIPSLLKMPTPNLDDTIALMRRGERMLTDVADEMMLLGKGQVPRHELMPGSLSDAVRDTIDMMRASSAISDRNIELELAANLPPVRIALRRCSRMLASLVRNAANATEAGGSIRVKVHQTTPESVIVQVSDDGPGLANEAHERVFDPTFSTRAGAGLGIGLSICQAVMQAHGGTLTCESTPSGTSFLAIFPVAR